MKKKGFTLIELMMVLAVLAIVMGLIFKVYTQQIKKTRNSERQNEVEYHTKNAVNRIVKEVEKYRMEVYLKSEDSINIYKNSDVKVLYYKSDEKAIYILNSSGEYEKVITNIKAAEFSYSDSVTKSLLKISVTGEIDGFTYKLDTGVSLK